MLEVSYKRSAQPEVSSARSAQLDQFNSVKTVKSARPGLTSCDLQLQKVITPLSELHFGCSWTLWKSH